MAIHQVITRKGDRFSWGWPPTIETEEVTNCVWFGLAAVYIVVLPLVVASTLPVGTAWFWPPVVACNE